MASMVKANRTNSSALCAPWSTFRLRLLAQFDLWETCRNYTLYWTNIVTATTEKRWRERGGWSGSRAGTSNECRRHLHPGLPVCLRAAYSTKCCSSVSCLSIRILSMLASLLLTGNKPGRGSGSGRGWARTNGIGHLLNMLCPARCASYCELPIYLGCCHVGFVGLPRRVAPPLATSVELYVAHFSYDKACHCWFPARHPLLQQQRRQQRRQHPVADTT